MFLNTQIFYGFHEKSMQFPNSVYDILLLLTTNTLDPQNLTKFG